MNNKTIEDDLEYCRQEIDRQFRNLGTHETRCDNCGGLCGIIGKFKICGNCNRIFYPKEDTNESAR